MKTYLCMMRGVLVVPAIIMVCANRMLRNWLMMDDMGGGIMMWGFLIILILTGCIPY